MDATADPRVKPEDDGERGDCHNRPMLLFEIKWLAIMVALCSYFLRLNVESRAVMPIFAFVLCLIITLGQNYQAFLQDKIDWYGVTATYIGIPLFLLIWFGYKLSQGTRVVKYSEMEFPKMDVK